MDEDNTPEKMALRLKFGRKVRQIRRALDLTQEKLAEKAQMHVTYVSSIERGQRNVSFDSIVSLAMALGVSSKELMPD